MAREEQFVSEENGAMTMVCLFFVGPSGGLERTLSISAQIVPGTATGWFNMHNYTMFCTYYQETMHMHANLND